MRAAARSYVGFFISTSLPLTDDMTVIT